MESNKNTAVLLGYYGGDNTHALAAWSSTFLELNLEMPEDINMRVDHIVEHILKNSSRIRDVKQLLAFLGENSHTSPFRFSSLHFATCTDIATHIHFLKHSVAMQAENAESARYKELKEDKYYLPEDWTVAVNEKHLNMNYLNGQATANFHEYSWLQCLHDFSMLSNELYHKSLEDLTPVLGKSRAKETARFFKTYNSQINSNKMFSFDGFVQVYQKRNLKTHAQREIAEVVEQMLVEIKNIPGNPFKHSLEAFNL